MQHPPSTEPTTPCPPQTPRQLLQAQGSGSQLGKEPPLPLLPLSCAGTKLNNCNSLFILHLTVTYCKCSWF